MGARPRVARAGSLPVKAEVARRKFCEGDFSGFEVDADPNMTL